MIETANMFVKRHPDTEVKTFRNLQVGDLIFPKRLHCDREISWQREGKFSFKEISKKGWSHLYVFSNDEGTETVFISSNISPARQYIVLPNKGEALARNVLFIKKNDKNALDVLQYISRQLSDLDYPCGEVEQQNYAEAVEYRQPLLPTILLNQQKNLALVSKADTDKKELMVSLDVGYSFSNEGAVKFVLPVKGFSDTSLLDSIVDTFLSYLKCWQKGNKA